MQHNSTVSVLIAYPVPWLGNKSCIASIAYLFYSASFFFFLFLANPKPKQMTFLGSIVSWLTIKRLEQIALYNSYSQEIQKETLFNILQNAKNTEWGTMHSFADIGGIKDFQSRFPVQDYNSLKPYIDRIRNGEQNVLWGTPIKWFAKSSGTTSDKSKFIPVSPETLEMCHFQGGKDVLAMYLRNYPDAEVLKGKSLVLGGSHQIESFKMDSYFGDLSAILIQNMPFWAQFRRTPDISIALMDEWEEKIELMAKATIEDDVTSIAGVPSWTMVLLKRILELTGKVSIHDVWPNLELFIHGGVSFTPYRNEFKKLFKHNSVRYIETYNASEGFFAIQDDPASDDMLLMLDLGIFYEFIPMDQIGLPDPQTKTVDDVEEGQNYALVITTNSGLWRYQIGDTVTVTKSNPVKIKVSGRVKHFINAFGEELIIDNAEKALHKACEYTGSAIKEYTAAPVYMGENTKGAHQWLIEFSVAPIDLGAFVGALDDELKKINSDYEAKRYKSIALDLPIVTVAREGLFYDWLKKRGKLGGQHKIPRLSNDRTIIEEIMALL